MTRTEFEELVGARERIPQYFYEQEIEPLYYHSNEDKREFCARVYRTKRNSLLQIIVKTAAEAQRENRAVLEGCNIDPLELDRMDGLILDHMMTAAKIRY